MKNKIIIVFIIGAVFITFISYILNNGVFKRNDSTNIKKANKIQVVTSFYPIFFFASEIGKDKAEVINITPAGTEPHNYEPTTLQIAKIHQSNMLVLNGGQLEAWGDKIKNQLQETNILLVTAGEGLTNKDLNENGKVIKDPHIWLDPVLAKKQVVNLKNGFEKVNPQEKIYFQANAKELENKLDELDKNFKNGLSDCQKKDFITSHEAFGYLAARYNINQVAISGISPDEEPSAQKLAEITNLVKKEGIKVIFFENLVSPKLSQTIAQETGAKTLVLDPIEGINSEDLKTGHNYFTVMRENLTNLQIALQCKK